MNQTEYPNVRVMICDSLLTTIGANQTPFLRSKILALLSFTLPLTSTTKKHRRTRFLALPGLLTLRKLVTVLELELLTLLRRLRRLKLFKRVTLLILLGLRLGRSFQCASGSTAKASNRSPQRYCGVGSQQRGSAS